MGKTYAQPVPVTADEKHPHVRGEDVEPLPAPEESLETPPRAWGRQNCWTNTIRQAGNTPTCVGKTPRARENENAGRKHPHVRGEDLLRSLVASALVETPPRAWGRHDVGAGRIIACRNTPTCVGKTTHSWNRHNNKRKHPHVRGEDIVAPIVFKNQLETPPRAWGRRPEQSRLLASGGNTPTCVGKTC